MDGLLEDWTAPKVADLGSINDAAAGTDFVPDGPGGDQFGSI